MMEKQLFWSTVVKEREIEIGYPTQVKHVAHIGCEGSSGSAPGWVSSLSMSQNILKIFLFYSLYYLSSINHTLNSML